jgi:hypothetical protein
MSLKIEGMTLDKIIASEEKSLAVHALHRFLEEGYFQTEKTGESFTEDELAQIVENITDGLPIPAFGATQTNGIVYFKSARIQQVCKAIATATGLTSVSNQTRRRLISAQLKFVVINETYCKGLEPGDISKALNFYL